MSLSLDEDSTQSAVPDWLNSSFIGKHLRNHYKNDGIRIISFKAEPDSGDLGNFASKIFRINVTFSCSSENEVNFIRTKFITNVRNT